MVGPVTSETMSRPTIRRHSHSGMPYFHYAGIV
jgi:hypothetical protein